MSGALIGHVDTWTAWVNSSNNAVAAASDFIGMDAYPYFQNTMANSIETGASLFNDALDATRAAVGGKPVWITETGWPVSGKTENQAIPNTDNAKTYWDQVGCPLFGNVNTWWFTQQDSAPVTPNPSFGIVGSTLSTTPLFDLSCSGVSSSSSASSAVAGSSSTASASGSASASGESATATASGSTGSGSGSGSSAVQSASVSASAGGSSETSTALGSGAASLSSVATATTPLVSGGGGLSPSQGVPSIANPSATPTGTSGSGSSGSGSGSSGSGSSGSGNGTATGGGSGASGTGTGTPATVTANSAMSLSGSLLGAIGAMAVVIAVL